LVFVVVSLRRFLIRFLRCAKRVAGARTILLVFRERLFFPVIGDASA
jgi:hypothetical protein